jgi:hypothetical protein
MNAHAAAADRLTDFSIVLGGPLFRLWRRLHLADGELGLLRRRVVAISLFCWLPLLVLSLLERKLYGTDVAVPFLLDVEVHSKLLIAVPILIAAEPIANQRLRHVAAQFIDRGLVAPADHARFDAALSAMARWRDSDLGEALLLVLVYAIGIIVVWRHYTALDTSTWYAVPGSGTSALSWTGVWYGYVSLPIFQFLLLRWYLRTLLWGRFLWQVSGIPLRLVPMHPDRVGGLGLLSTAGVVAFIPLAAAHGVMLAGYIAGRIFYLGASLPAFKAQIAALAVFTVGLVLVPLFAFSRQLWLAKLAGGREYGTLAQLYVRDFDEKWLRGGAAAGEQLLGSADIQSLADMQNSIETVQGMRSTVFTRESILLLALATLAPIAPLMLTMMPLEELVKQMFTIFF